MVQLSHPYMNTGKTIVLTIEAFVGKVMPLLFKKFFYFSNLMFISHKINHPLKYIPLLCKAHTKKFG